ncbi:MAG: LytTR family DNA-binding domain-containing protein [Hespellia sp.]|nr:LytTR family DNA-binding domain-containing protein [Hespellia sp.]
MIVMFIFGTEKKEIQCVYQCSRELAGRWSDEYWDITLCLTVDELMKETGKRESADMICIDITVKGAIPLAMRMREKNPLAYIILIADTKISPVAYMKPSIRAESLMLKPLSNQAIREVLTEAYQSFLKRFYHPDEKKVFVIENKTGRTLVDYESINFFESRDKKVYLNTDAKEYGFYETLDQLEERLAENFIRCHRSFLVNKNKILQIFLSRNTIVLQGEMEVPVSRTYKAALKEYQGGAEQN